MSTWHFIGEMAQCVAIFGLWWGQCDIVRTLERAGVKPV